jgi:hypothetical protein
VRMGQIIITRRPPQLPGAGGGATWNPKRQYRPGLLAAAPRCQQPSALVAGFPRPVAPPRFGEGRGRWACCP